MDEIDTEKQLETSIANKSSGENYSPEGSKSPITPRSTSKHRNVQINHTLNINEFDATIADFTPRSSSPRHNILALIQPITLRIQNCSSNKIAVEEKFKAKTRTVKESTVAGEKGSKWSEERRRI